MVQVATAWDGVALKIVDHSLWEDDTYAVDELDVPAIVEGEAWPARLRRVAAERALKRWRCDGLPHLVPTPAPLKWETYP